MDYKNGHNVVVPRGLNLKAGPYIQKHVAGTILVIDFSRVTYGYIEYGRNSSQIQSLERWQPASFFFKSSDAFEKARKSLNHDFKVAQEKNFLTVSTTPCTSRNVMGKLIYKLNIK
jgi:hypothetical protein